MRQSCSDQTNSVKLQAIFVDPEPFSGTSALDQSRVGYVTECIVIASPTPAFFSTRLDSRPLVSSEVFFGLLLCHGLQVLLHRLRLDEPFLFLLKVAVSSLQ